MIDRCVNFIRGPGTVLNRRELMPAQKRTDKSTVMRSLKMS